MNDAKYIGLDVHQATISVAVRDSRGNLVMEAILETKADTILEFIQGLRGSLSVTIRLRSRSRGRIVRERAESSARLEQLVTVCKGTSSERPELAYERNVVNMAKDKKEHRHERAAFSKNGTYNPARRAE
jgi:hypothetical protein